MTTRKDLQYADDNTIISAAEAFSVSTNTLDFSYMLMNRIKSAVLAFKVTTEVDVSGVANSTIEAGINILKLNGFKADRVKTDNTDTIIIDWSKAGNCEG